MPLSRINLSASGVSGGVVTRQHRIIHQPLCQRNAPAKHQVNVDVRGGIGSCCDHECKGFA